MVKRAGIVLIIVILATGMGGCETSCTPAATPVLQYSLVISSSTGGSVTTPGEGVFVRQDGTTVNLEAEEDECYEFVGWTGDAVADSGSATTTIFMDTDKEIVANFVLRNYDLTVSSTEGGSVTTPGEGVFTYGCGAIVSLDTEAEDGYRFVEWTGDTDAITSPAAPETTITIRGNYAVTAKFIRQYSLNISSTEGGSVTVPGQGSFTYDEGTVVSLKAETEESYTFSEWNGDTETIANSASAETTITMEAHYSITASFILFGGGNGTIENPYQIADWRQLDNIRNYSDGHFILVSNLDSTSIGYEELASETANEAKGWQPIGSFASRFAGNFNGQGYQISDLFVDRPDQDHKGLFGVTHGESIIKNVGVVNANVAGKDDTGILVGKNEGSVSNSYSTGSVAGSSHVGGLVGKNEGSVSNAFWDIETSGQSSSSGGTGENTMEMMDIATFENADWDIIAVAPGERNPAYIWNIVGGQTYPFLSWERPS